MSDISAAAEPGDADQDQGTDGGSGGGGKVIATICMGSDGTFTLYQGDEPDEDEGAEGEGSAPGATADAGATAGAAAAPGAQATPPADAGGAGEEGGEEADQGEQFQDVGQLMKAVLETVKQAESEGTEGEQSNMESGFDDAGGAGGAAPVTAQPPGM